MNAKKKNSLSAWWPSYLILCIFTIVLVLFISGSQAKILAWYLILCLPVLGIFYLFGSIPLKEGSKVVEGDIIGRCGNSGNTSGPHIHVHYQAHDPRTVTLLAQGLPLFFRDHEGPVMPNGGQIFDGGKVVYFGDEILHLPTK